MNKHAKTAARGSVQQRIADQPQQRRRVTQAPSFNAKGLDLELDGKRVLSVTLGCKRSGCGKWFIVRKADLRHRESFTMPCPHCFRVSVIPDAKSLARL